MKYVKIATYNDYTIIDRGNKITEIAVVYRLNDNKKEWDYTANVFIYNNEAEKVNAILKAADYCKMKIENDYIPRIRLEELATLFKDGLIEDDRESALEYFDEICEMSEEEKEWFGIEEDSPIANTKFENPMYNKGYDDGFSDGANSIDE